MSVGGVRVNNLVARSCIDKFSLLADDCTLIYPHTGWLGVRSCSLDTYAMRHNIILCVQQHAIIACFV
jgi:hypothetical protein